MEETADGEQDETQWRDVGAKGVEVCVTKCFAKLQEDGLQGHHVGLCRRACRSFRRPSSACLL